MEEVSWIAYQKYVCLPQPRRARPPHQVHLTSATAVGSEPLSRSSHQMVVGHVLPPLLSASYFVAHPRHPTYRRSSQIFTV